MDVVRPAVEAELGTSVEFVISCAAVSQGRSYVIAEPQRRGGGKIRYSEEDFPFGITVTASLAFREGRWRLLEHVIGDSDSAHAPHVLGWDTRYLEPRNGTGRTDGG